MTSTRNALSAVAFSAVTLTAILATSSMASANPGFGFGAGLGHGPVITGGFKGFGNRWPFHPPHEGSQSSGSGGHLISCHPFTGCTNTPYPPANPPSWGGNPPRYRDPGYSRWHEHWRPYGFGFGFASYYGPSYAPGCEYEYKVRSNYVPGYGYERKVYKVCKVI